MTYKYCIFTYDEIYDVNREFYNYLSNRRELNNVHYWLRHYMKKDKNKWQFVMDNNVEFSNWSEISKVKYNFVNYLELYNKIKLYDNIKKEYYCLPYYILTNNNYKQQLKNIPKDNKLYFLKYTATYTYGGYDVYPIFADDNLEKNILKAMELTYKYKKYKTFNKEPFTLQLGVQKPLLLDGYKFDFRIYYLVVSVNNHISFFINNNALIRKTGTLYNKDSKDKNIQLTNTTYNRTTVELNKLTEIFNEQHKLYYLMPKIINLCRNLSKLFTPHFISHEPCFYIYGIDVIFDNKEQPYLLEANITPAFYTTEHEIKELHKNIEKYIFDGILENVIENLLQNKLINKSFNNYTLCFTK